MLSLIYFAAGSFTPVIVKAICILLWIAAGYLLNITARDTWKLNDYYRYGVLIMWFASITIVKNSLGGLENILSAFQLLLLYYISWKNLVGTNGYSNLTIGILAGWTILTRLDAGLLAAAMVIIYLLYKRSRAGQTNFAVSLLVILLTSIIVLLPWYLYQYSYTGNILSDSSVARMFTGRRNSIEVINGLIYFHPKALLVLVSFLVPISVGYLITLFKIRQNNSFYYTTALILVMFTVLAYTFIVGADQFGRYFLICMPLFLLSGFYGLQNVLAGMKNIRLANRLVYLLIIFLFVTNAYDYFKRVIKIEQLESNIYETFYAPSHRIETTSNYLKKLGFDTNNAIKLAITEVQFKYFVDERIEVISLDGRSSGKILKYVSKDGFPDFEKFIEDEKPDIVEVKGWSSFVEIPGMTFKKPQSDNLLSLWEERITGMKPGESFKWKNNTVTYIMPWHVKISYNTN